MASLRKPKPKPAPAGVQPPRLPKPTYARPIATMPQPFEDIAHGVTSAIDMGKGAVGRVVEGARKIKRSVRK